MIKYSVIIPVYKAEYSIANCLDSLLNQNREDVEIIAVNDGSPDNSKEILDAYQAEHNNLHVIHQENGGVSSARNAGLTIATGEYILFVDSDDYVADNYFQLMDQFRDEDLCVFARQNIGSQVNDSEFFKGIVAEENYGSLLRKLITGRKMLPPWNKRYKRSIIEANHVRFIPEFVIGEDFDFCMRYAIHCTSVTVSSDILYYLDVSDTDSLSRKYRKNLTKKLKTVYLHVEKTIKRSPNGYFEKKAILEAVDYLYARNVVACFSEEFKKGQYSYIKLRRKYQAICKCFSNTIGKSGKYVNKTHQLLRLLIKFRMTFAIYMIAYIAKH